VFLEKFKYPTASTAYMEKEVLIQIGFTNAEAKVYLTLLELGSVKVGKIIEKSGLQSSTVHNTLHSLIEKGFVSYIKKGKIKLYQSTEPELVLKTIQEKERRFREILPNLKLKQRLAKEKQVVEIYEGYKGVFVMLNKLIEDAKPGDNYYFFAVDIKGKNVEVQKFFARYDTRRKEKRLVVRGLAPRRLKKLFEKRKYLKMKYVNFPIPSSISICNNKMIITSWEDKPIGIYIESREITRSQAAFFEEIWSKVK